MSGAFEGCEHKVSDSASELDVCEDLQMPGVEGDLSDPCVPSSSVSENLLLRSPQLSDFGLERYMVSRVPNPPPQAADSLKEGTVVSSYVQLPVVSGKRYFK
ncbi:spindle and kinetochore-associated protein 3 [Cricetulus griseus]|nr:spindle and kinetochore-associated protein 3 [Cricetulus griseus]